MSLVLEIIDTKTKKTVSTNGLYTDTFIELKEKLFLSDPNFPPNICKITSESGAILDNDSNLNEYLTRPVYVTCILNDDKLVHQLTRDASKLIHLVNDMDAFENLFVQVSEEYTNIESQDLKFSLGMLFGNFLNVDPVEQSEYISGLSKLRDSLSEKYRKKGLAEFVKKLQSTKLSTESKIISANIRLDISENSLLKFNLGTIFNAFKLNETTPMILLDKKEANSDKPLIKVLDKVPDDRNFTKDLKSWVLNEKKKLGLVAYKHLKGLHLRVWVKETKSFMHLEINDSGSWMVSLEDNQIEPYFSDVVNLFKVVLVLVNNIAISFTEINGGVIYIGSETDDQEVTKFKPFTIDSCNLTSLSTFSVTDTYINKNNIETLLNEMTELSSLAHVRQTESLDSLSISFKSGSGKDITVNLKDNPHNLDSSLIFVHNALNIQTSLIICEYLKIFSKMILANTESIFEDTVEVRKAREKSNKKFLREQGIIFDSRECQGDRQPNLVMNNEDSNSNSNSKNAILIFKGQKYKCPHEKYPHPGFTSNNIVCCFKNNQTSQETYIRNTHPEALSIYLHPSNFRVKIKTSSVSSTIIDTFVLKSTEDNSYYILIPRKDSHMISLNRLDSPKLVEDLDNLEDSIWLEPVSLATLIYPSSTNKCSKLPDLSLMASEDIDKPCASHPKHRYFGYGIHGIPCCFDKPKPIVPSKASVSKKKNLELSKRYIITSNKLLNKGKLGKLPKDILQVTELLNQTNLYRLGVHQNKNSYLNAIQEINEGSIFQKIHTFLENNQSRFSQINEGGLLQKYKTIENFIESINSNLYKDDHSEYHQLIEDALNTSILILEEKEEGETHQILCNPNLDVNRKSFSILLKRENYYEIIVQKEEDILTKVFSVENPFIQFLLDYSKKSCIMIDEYPDKFTYIKQLVAENILDTTTELGNPKYQVVSPFNKVDFILTDLGYWIPIRETTILSGLNKINLDLIFSGNVDAVIKSLYEVVYSIDVLNESLLEPQPEAPFIEIVGKMKSSERGISGLLLNTGDIIPFKTFSGTRSDFETESGLFKDLPQIYYPLAEKYLRQVQEEIPNETIKYQRELFEIKFNLQEFFKKNTVVANELKRLVRSKGIPREEKYTKLNKFLKNHVDKKDWGFVGVISNELLNDNINAFLLNGIVTSDMFDILNVKIHKGETMLSSVKDITDWVRQK